MNTINKVISTASHRALGIFLGCVMFSAGGLLPAYGVEIECSDETGAYLAGDCDADLGAAPNTAGNSVASGHDATVETYAGTLPDTRTDRVYVVGGTPGAGNLGDPLTKVGGSAVDNDGGKLYFVVDHDGLPATARRYYGIPAGITPAIAPTATTPDGIYTQEQLRLALLAGQLEGGPAGTTLQDSAGTTVQEIEDSVPGLTSAETATLELAGGEGERLGHNAVAVGAGSTVVGEKSTAIGAGALVGETNSPAPNSVAIGAGATVIGAEVAVADAEAGEATAIGAESSVTGKGGTAIGFEATVTGNNGIAIGSGVEAGANEIVIGAATATRVEVGGIDLIDARADINTNADNIAANTALVNTFEEDIETNRSGIAMAVALAHLPLIEGPKGGWAIAGGSFDGESAVAIGANWNVGTNKFIKLGVANSNGESSFGAGFGMGF